jgi:hypothetical protein
MRMWRGAVVVCVAAAMTMLQGVAQTASVIASQIHGRIDGSQTTELQGNVHPVATAANDRGPVAGSLSMDRMLLVLKRTPDQDAALRSLLDAQQDKSSPQYHAFLTPQQFGQQFGPSDSDLAQVVAWLQASGFSAVQPSTGRTVIEFSGTAATVEAAFHTSIHQYSYHGALKVANATNPSIPTALVGLVGGIASLNNFGKAPQNISRGTFSRNMKTGEVKGQTNSAATTGAAPNFTYPDPNYNQTDYGLTPYDIATIYNVTPLWNASVDGTGQTIAIVGRTEINPADFVNYRKLFGLPLGTTTGPTGTQYLNIIHNGNSPGFTSDEGEADIDTQWSGAVAKGATIDYVVSNSTFSSDGVDLSALYIVDNNLAPVMSESYGQCEASLGASGNQFVSQLWQQAAAQGITAMVSTGDSGAAGCDEAGSSYADYGNAVNGLASTPYDVAVGGTDFSGIFYGGASTYFSATNSTNGQSAKSYIPENPWNDSCTNPIWAFTSTWNGLTPEAVCNTASASADGLLYVVGGSGGASSCTAYSNGNSLSTAVASCTAKYPKPAWQTGSGVPADGARDVPDVSMFASNGFYGAIYLVCQQDANQDGNACNTNAPYTDFEGYGGTSVASPVFAGVMSLVNAKTGARQGLANYALYNLFTKQVAAATACNASQTSGTLPASSCLFNDITAGSNSMPCLKGSPNCTVTNSSDTYGTLSGGLAGTGYDIATGLGSVNAANLVNNWTTATFSATTTKLTLSPTTITHGAAVAANVTVSATSGTPTGSVSLNGTTSLASVGAGTLAGGTYTGNFSNFPGGTYSVTAHYGGDTTYAESDSAPVTLTVNPESSGTVVELVNAYGNTVSGGSYPYGQVLLVRPTIFNSQGAATHATGTVKVTNNGALFDGGVLALNANGYAEDYSPSLVPGTFSFTGVYSGDSSYSPSTSAATPTLTITKGPTTTGVESSSTSVSTSSSITFYAEIDTSSYGYYAPTGPVTFKNGTAVIGTATLKQTHDPTSDLDYSYTNLTVPASKLTVGTDSITAVYAGDGNYGTSTSSSTSVTVTQGTLTPTTTSLSVTPTSIRSNGGLTFNSTVTPAVSGASIQIVIDGMDYAYGTTGTTGNVTFTIAGNLTPGTHTVTAIFLGTTTYAASTSPAVTITVIPGTTASSTAISITPASVTQGTSVSATATVTPSAATGYVQLLIDGNVASANLAISGGTTTTTIPTTGLSVGTHQLQFFYAGDATYAPSTSATTTLTVGSIGVNTPGFTLTPATSTLTATRGATTSAITYTVTPTGGFSGTVTFTCSNLPSLSTCSFNPTSVTASNATAASTALTITTTAPSASEREFSRLAEGGGAVAFASLLMLVLPLRRRRLMLPLLSLLLLAGLVSLTGCGGGGSGTGSSSGGTPTGTYTVTVTASGTSGAATATQTSTIALTVQ